MTWKVAFAEIFMFLFFFSFSSVNIKGHLRVLNIKEHNIKDSLLLLLLLSRFSRVQLTH